MSDIEVSVKTVDGIDVLATGVTDTFDVEVLPVTDAANLIINDTSAQRVSATNTFALDIAVSVPDSDQSLDIVLTNVLGELSAGVSNGNNQWTLQESDLANLSITPASDVSSDFDIAVQVVTQDGIASSKTTASQSITIKTDADETLTYTGNSLDGYGGNDTVEVGANLVLDFSKLDNIETIDLGENGAHSLDGLTLSDVLDMTDANNTLTILGTDNEDEVSLNIADGWEKGATTNGITEYKNTADSSVTLNVQDQIDTSTGF